MASKNKDMMAREVVARKGSKRVELSGPQADGRWVVTVMQEEKRVVPGEANDRFVESKWYSTEAGARRAANKILASRPGAKATFKVEDRFYFGKGRKDRFWARGYDDAKDRVRRSPELGKYAKIIMQPEFDTADHWEWVSRASTSEIVNWAKSISRDI
jgi:hypothetical protein